MTRVVLLLLFAIHPVVDFQDYLAETDCDDAAFGPGGDVYLACHSQNGEDMDARVVRMRQGNVVWGTTLRGSAYDGAFRVNVDRQGAAYVVGFTKSPDFLGRFDAHAMRTFLVKLDANGKVDFATLLDAENGDALAVDQAAGVAYVGGTQQGHAFVAKVRVQDGSVSTTRFSGEGKEKVTGISLDGRGGLYVTGYTESAEYFGHKVNGRSDAFLARLHTFLLSLDYGLLLGGSGEDSGWGVATGRDGSAVVAGITASNDFPVSPHAFQRHLGGASDAFVAKVVNGRLVWATYYGGSAADEAGYDGGDVKVDSEGTIWLAGQTHSTDLPVTRGTYAGGDGDGFVAAFSADGHRLLFGSYFGGAGRDLLEGLDVAHRRVIATGLTNSPHGRFQAMRVGLRY